MKPNSARRDYTPGDPVNWFRHNRGQTIRYPAEFLDYSKTGTGTRAWIRVQNNLGEQDERCVEVANLEKRPG